MISAHVAFRIADHIMRQDLLYLTDDDQQARTLADQVSAVSPGAAVLFVPSSDALPGDTAPPTPANSGARVAALRTLRQHQQAGDAPHFALILSGEAAGRRYPPPESFDAAPPRLCPGDRIDLDAFAAMVEDIGYIVDDRVDEPGEVAVRGDVVDIFPADVERPVRIEIVDGRIVAIRGYDPITQRTMDDIDMVEIGRASEPEIAEGVPIVAHLGAGALALSKKAESRRARFVKLAADVAQRSGTAIDAIDDERWAEACRDWTTIDVEDAVGEVPRFAEMRAPFAALKRFVEPRLAEGRAFLLVGHRRDLRFLRGKVAKKLSIELPEIADFADVAALDRGAGGTVVMPCATGFVDDRYIVVAAADILGSRALLTDDAVVRPAIVAATGEDVRSGDIVIHEDHGVARILGLDSAPGGDAAGEMIALEFVKGARRLVAVEDADRLWRYGADADAVTLDTLNGNSWSKRRETIAASIAETARGLAELTKQRATLEAAVIDPDAAAYERFVGGFAFNETPDQARAIAAVRQDLSSGRPMDRLVIGDVGYGKTEVAIRAAALAAFAGYQVIVAAPTTVLVRQHLDSFRRRFEGTDITVAGLSRLSSAAEKKATKVGLADGSIDIVVGTGMVKAKGVTYARLGLVVIDEEQRFGAADKARLRGTGDTHLLTLSATPIPRTLQMAMIGLQQMSAITTPPARRQPIRTSVDRWDDSRIRTALLREKGRGGQSFVVVPRIEDMAGLGATLKRIVPDLAVVEAHGKMPAAAIDEVMVDFADGRGDVLLATNIIEAGLDVPRANTMIVWRADRFGLAQLHQLRGRVGRGNRRGQVMLVTAGENEIAERTHKRLRTLAAFDRLGAGFSISAQDLEMRGSGDLIGDDQAGHVSLIGTDLYQHLLGSALRAARGEAVDDWTPELHIGASGCLPAAWIPEADVRLSLYIRLARLTDESAIDAFEEELVDRFGPLPDPAGDLLAHARIRATARALGVGRIDAGPAGIALTPRKGFATDPTVAGLVAKNGRLLLAENHPEAERITRVQTVLEALAE